MYLGLNLSFKDNKTPCLGIQVGQKYYFYIGLDKLKSCRRVSMNFFVPSLETKRDQNVFGRKSPF